MPNVPSETTALLADVGVESIRRIISRDSYKATDDLDIPDLEVRGESELVHQPTTWRGEAILLARYAAPLIVTYLMQYTFSFMIIYMSGRLGPEELAAASIATMTANITGMVVFESLASCLDTLTSQAYGNENKEMVGVHVQRMIVMVLLVTIPIGAIWLTAPFYLVHLIPEIEIAKLAAKFLRIYLIGAPGYGIFEAGKRFAQAQGDFTAGFAVLLVSSPLNIFFSWFFVIYLDFGFEGTALASAVSYNIQPLLLLAYIYLLAPSTHACWPGIAWHRILKNWGPMLRLAFPSFIMIISEWLAFEVLTFATSYLGAKQLAAQSVLMTIGVAMYHIPFPASVAASTRFGNLIGSGNLKAARTAFNTHYTMFLGIGVFDIVLLVSLRGVIPVIFTEDEDVRRLITKVMPLMAVLQFFDAMTAISNGLLRGLGKQKIGGWINASAYYVVGTPLAMTLAFGPPDLGLTGMWIGPIVGLGLATTAMFVYMRLTDWEKAVEEAKNREE